MNIFNAASVNDGKIVYINAEQIVSAQFSAEGLHVSLTNGQDHLLKMSERDFQMIMFSVSGTHGSLSSGDFWYEKH